MQFTKATVILRGYNYQQVRSVAQALLDSQNIKNMEITLNTENAFDIIEKISQEFGNELNVGAGTVLTFDDLKEAIHRGAKFVLSPNMMSAEMIKYCNEHQVICIPGAFTPTEIYSQILLGADIIKVFPATELSYSYANKVREPLGDLKLMAVGGVNQNNVQEVLKSGYSHVGSAGGIFNKQDILDCDVEKLKASMKLFDSKL